MTDFLFTLAVLTFALWGLMDIYFYNILFDPVRAFGERLVQNPSWAKRIFGYGLNCRYCLSHWAALLLLAPVMIFPCCVAQNLTIVDALLILVTVPRLALVLHDYVLRPLTYEDSYGEPPDGR